jgi:hypothetical protein
VSLQGLDFEGLLFKLTTYRKAEVRKLDGYLVNIRSFQEC